ncbi:hypothetical protein OIU76_024688 [Salix suchowensis]|nr:hypothetical protein OIU76_024688 [Salix suchowensis]
MNTQEKIEAAGKKKGEGNAWFKAGKYERASRRYEKATKFIEYDSSFTDEEKQTNQSFAPRLSKDREGGDSPPQPCIAIALQLGGLDTLIYSVFSYFLGVQVLHCFLSLSDYCLLVLHCCCQYLGGFWVLLLLLLR